MHDSYFNWISDLIPELLNVGRASFNLENFNLFPDGMYEEEGERARRLDALMNHSSSCSPELSHGTPLRGCAITFLLVLSKSIGYHEGYRAS